MGTLPSPERFGKGHGPGMLPRTDGGQQHPSPLPGTAETSLDQPWKSGFGVSHCNRFPSIPRSQSFPVIPVIPWAPWTGFLLGCTALLTAGQKSPSASSACSQPGSPGRTWVPSTCLTCPRSCLWPVGSALPFPLESSQRGFRHVTAQLKDSTGNYREPRDTKAPRDPQTPTPGAVPRATAPCHLPSTKQTQTKAAAADFKQSAAKPTPALPPPLKRLATPPGMPMEGYGLGRGCTGLSLAPHRRQSSQHRHSKAASGPGSASASPPSSGCKSSGAPCTPWSAPTEPRGCRRLEAAPERNRRCRPCTVFPLSLSKHPHFPLAQAHPALLALARAAETQLLAQTSPEGCPFLPSPSPHINIQRFPQPLSPSSPNTSCPY